jgi:hypothetical protein
MEVVAVCPIFPTLDNSGSIEVSKVRANIEINQRDRQQEFRVSAVLHPFCPLGESVLVRTAWCSISGGETLAEAACGGYVCQKGSAAEIDCGDKEV